MASTWIFSLLVVILPTPVSVSWSLTGAKSLCGLSQEAEKFSTNGRESRLPPLFEAQSLHVA